MTAWTATKSFNFNECTNNLRLVLLFWLIVVSNIDVRRRGRHIVGIGN